jgi:endo-1,4-beta-mannosidase
MDRLRLDGRPFTAIGVNYHPTTSGCDLLSAWDPDRLAADFDAMARRGCNTVRFFVPWREVEPAAGAYDAEALARLAELTRLADAAGLLCVPALLTIFMNGELLDLPWRAGRDLWTDATMRGRAREYVARVAAELGPTGNVLAYDLGDELIHIDPAAARSLGRAAAADWLAEMAAAIRAADPGARVMLASEPSAIFGDHPFGVDNAAAVDLLGLHAFPLWSPVAIESTRSPKASLLPAFLARLGAAFGVPLTDELGAYAVAPEVAADHLRAAGHSALANGSAGVLAWCWQDIAATGRPYDVRPQERLAGLLDLEGRPKPALAELERLAARAAAWSGLAPPPSPVAILIPELWRPAASSYLEDATAGAWARAAFYAFALAKRAHLPVELSARSLPHHRLLICPSVERLTLRDQAEMTAFLDAGGTLLYSSGTVLHGLGPEELFGVRPRDFTVDPREGESFELEGTRFPLDWGPEPRLPVLEAGDAEVLAAFPNGGVALARRRHGDGTAYYLNAPFERQLDLPGRLESHDWERLYASIAAAAGIVREVDCDAPAVELALLADGEERVAVAINHAPEPVAATVDLGPAAAPRRLDLPPKGVEVLRPGGDRRSAPHRE